MKDRRKGFTLTELTVVLVIMAIITAIAVPFFVKYWKIAEFRKNESNARTVYLAAESRLTWYRSSGQWEEFQQKVRAKGKKAEFDATSDLSKHDIWAVTLDAGVYGTVEAEDNPVLELLDDSAYDKEILSHAIAIEIDLESGEVYSAFYGSRCKGLDYADADADGYLTMKDRAYESRRKRLLGYYSAEDTVNVVALDPLRLRIVTISLLNSERLTLNWSSNVGLLTDVSYKLTFYKKDSDEKLFSFVMSPYDMDAKGGWTGSSGSISEMASFTLLDKDDKAVEGSWDFPVTRSQNGYSLVLDAMMSTETLATLDAQSAAAKEKLERTESTSILRLAQVADVLKDEQTIYATVQAVPYEGTENATITREYRSSEAVASNTANTLYGDDTKDDNVEISTWRHLSNLRYRTRGLGDTKPETYTLTAKNMDWTSVGTGLYSLKEAETVDHEIILRPCWNDNSGTEAADFPTIPKLYSGAALEGKGAKTLLTNLKVGSGSILSDETAKKLKDTEYTGLCARYLGLFAEIEGSVDKVTLKDPCLTLVSGDTQSYTKLRGVGILAGRVMGNLTDVEIQADKTAGTTKKAAGEDRDTVYVDLTKNGAKASVGGVIGVIASIPATGDINSVYNNNQQQGLQIKNVVMGGTMEVKLPSEAADRGTVDTIPTRRNGVIHYGIGGIAGYAYLNNTADYLKLDSCVNHADVSGNLFTGGVVGRIDGNREITGAGAGKDTANLVNCSNDGLILSNVKTDLNTFTGQYIGGIAGYGYQAVLYGNESASGRDSSFTYDESKRSKLQGTYVGGIIGYGSKTLISNCSTQEDGYVLGENYVGGIAGALDHEVENSIQTTDNVLVTTNRNYVIGENYVGGITGSNTGGVTLKDCVNNGVAAAYGRYAGGIAGYNDKGATILDCVSYLSDYDSSVFRMIVDTWKTKGSYVGGIAGYNNGAIRFSESNTNITVKSVSSIVAGQDYVGGIAGFNDVSGTLDVHYDLIGGRIYGYGNAVGGCFGFNASTQVLSQELIVKPLSVEGNYYVGGVVGANVVDLKNQNVEVSGFRAENSLGVIKGKAFVGGVIGYQRTFAASQIGAAEDTDAILDAVETAQKNSADSGKRLLPSLNADTRVPEAVLVSADAGTLTFSTKDNTDTDFAADTNNIPIQAGWYAGGVLGYCEKGSRLVVKNCRNAGNLSLIAGVQTEAGVSLQAYAASRELGKTLPAATKGTNLHFVGGVVGINLENQIIDHCTNTGNMSGCVGIGGIVGLNSGYIYDCSLSGNFGNASLNFLGGITAINIQGKTDTMTYKGQTYTSGTVEKCSTVKGRSVSGRNCVGGIAAWNLNGAVVKGNVSAADVNAAGDYAGGVAGRNSGCIYLEDAAADTASRSVQGRRGQGIGGIVGVNEQGGTFVLPEGLAANAEFTAVGPGLTITGNQNVGGIVGINEGTLGAAGYYLTSRAGQVRAISGNAGGVVGYNTGDITHVTNRSASVTADAGAAGGVTGQNESGHKIADSRNYGNVTSSNGYAGGIAAANAGTIENCTVSGGSGTASIEIYSRGVKESGAIAAINSGTITGSVPGSGVALRGAASIYGSIVGKNQASGLVTAATVKEMPAISATGGSLTVGGAAGQNEGTISNLTVSLTSMSGLSSSHYAGGIAGTNGLENTGNESGNAGALITTSEFTGVMDNRNGGAATDCFGGITGINNARLEQNNVGKTASFEIWVGGVYTATSNSSTDEKEALSTHVGGVAGKNDTNGTISGCTIADNEKSQMVVGYGMLGGIAGFNKGRIELSGSDKTAAVMTGNAVDETLGKQERIAALNTNAQDEDLKADATYLAWNDNYENVGSIQLEDICYNGTKTRVQDGRLKLYMDSNGNLGGITAYNSAAGELTKCVSGNWFLSNKSSAIGVGTGGVIGMNESEKDLRFLVNGAFVGRQLNVRVGDTDRFAGGIIGNQNNSTTDDWVISDCINYGTVYCFRSHYSGGIMGQWTGSGGTIENCRNYGNLQTTYGCPWVGACGGIVAQLYHAYEGEEYNIISCGNYGSVYGRKGEVIENEKYANDSAGILGNITTYKVNNWKDGQSFTVQILDCVNAPGTKIYSGSMASGIFGFLSCERAENNSQVETSTQNVKLRIERCLNFGKVLKGNNYYSGIFGDRYGDTAWRENTVVKDCFSVNLGSNEYSGGNEESPVFGKGRNKSLEGPFKIAEQNRKNNYYLEARSQRLYDVGKVNLAEGTDTGKYGWNSVTNSQAASGSNSKYVYYLYFMKDITNGTYFAAAVNRTETINGSTNYIDENGYLVDANHNRLGEVLFYCDGNDRTYTHDNVYYIMTTDPDNVVFLNARTAYRRLEGIITDEAGTKKLLEPASVQADIINGLVNVTVTPKDLPTNSELKCDPFAYLVTVRDASDQVVAQHRIYDETGSFELPDGVSGGLTVEVQAVSMYEDVENSDAVRATTKEVSTILPDPKVRVEVVTVKNAGKTENRDDYRYRFTLENLDAYNAVREDGTYLYDNWQVVIKVQNMGEVTLKRSNTSGNLAPQRDNTNIYQMTAQASDPDGKLESSQTVSTAVALHYHYRADMSLNTWTPANPSFEVTGKTLDELAMTVSLDASSSSAVNTPPIYRVELLGDWTDQDKVTHKDTVLAETDVLTVSQGIATATFNNLPDYVGDAENMRLRIWYASSGLGPVYTYRDVDTEDEANVKQLAYVDEDGKGVWNYSYSTVLENQNYYYTKYIYQESGLWTWLPRPVLEGTDKVLLPDENMRYTFKWDQGVSGAATSQYQVSLVGIDESGAEVVLSATQTVDTNQFTIDGSDWNYQKVRLKVTRVGTNTATTKRIGLSSTGDYTIKPRLESPAQPTVTNADANELNYQFIWAANRKEEGCMGYQAYIQTYQADGTLSDAAELGEIVPVTEKKADGTYEKLYDLETYAGQKVVLYLKAIADPDGGYLDSLPGVTTELTIPKRLDEPSVTWTPGWNYETSRQTPTGADIFLNGLRISLTANPGSIPPGGSTYLLRAYVYDTEDEAKASAVNALGSPIYIYPEGYGTAGTGPVSMNVGGTTADYYHTMQNLSLKYAGKWIVFYTRISSGSGSVSSNWTKSGAYRLPYVRLAAPAVTDITGDRETFTAQVNDTPGIDPGSRDWTGAFKKLTWNSVDCADMYEMTLSGQVTNEDNSKTPIAETFRVLEKNGGFTVQRQEGDSWTDVDGTKDGGSYRFELSAYTATVTGTYKLSNNVTPSYETTLTAVLTITEADEGYTYTLILPDVTDITATDMVNGAEEQTTITGDGFRITQTVKIKANVQENLDTPGSEAYAESESSETRFN